MLRGFLLFALLSCQTSFHTDEGESDFTITTIHNQNYNIGINYSLDSSVKIVVFNEETKSAGQGSGNYFRIGSKRFVVTAGHNVEAGNKIKVLERNGNLVDAAVVYQELSSDVAILVPESDLVSTIAAPYRMNHDKNLLAKRLHFVGSPVELDFILSEAFVSASTYDTLLLQSSAWYGSSGSVVFDSTGKICGLIHGIKVAYEGPIPRILENYVIVMRFNFLSRSRIREILRDAISGSGNPH